mgnify:CR=1 FL=1
MSQEVVKKSLKEHLEKIKYRVNYNISETPKYKPVIEDELEFDEIPSNTYATQDGFPVPNVGGTDAYIEEQEDEEDENNDDQIPAPEGPKEPREPTNAPAPGQEEDVPEEPEGEPADEPVEPEAGEESPMEEPEEEGVDQIQNDIIKHNIEAMKGIQSKLEDLENINQKLNSQLDALNSKVEEVEEPTDAEKLMQKKEESYPYYFNLNDFWKNNWFDQQRAETQEKGIKELPDSTYIADFDDLPTSNDMDIEDSFNSLI